MFHDNQRVNAKDKFFVLGGNPDGNGGGVIASTNSLVEAKQIQLEAIKKDYSGVAIYTWEEMMGEGRGEIRYKETM